MYKDSIDEELLLWRHQCAVTSYLTYEVLSENIRCKLVELVLNLISMCTCSFALVTLTPACSYNIIYSGLLSPRIIIIVSGYIPFK